jgi:hypothetical protein
VRAVAAAALVGVRGEEPFGKQLFEPITTGIWIETREGDTFRSLDQQYFP